MALISKAIILGKVDKKHRAYKSANVYRTNVCSMSFITYPLFISGLWSAHLQLPLGGEEGGPSFCGEGLGEAPSLVVDFNQPTTLIELEIKTIREFDFIVASIAVNLRNLGAWIAFLHEILDLYRNKSCWYTTHHLYILPVAFGVELNLVTIGEHHVVGLEDDAVLCGVEYLTRSKMLLYCSLGCLRQLREIDWSVVVSHCGC